LARSSEATGRSRANVAGEGVGVVGLDGDAVEGPDGDVGSLLLQAVRDPHSTMHAIFLTVASLSRASE
jgi:hypothetical protein